MREQGPVEPRGQTDEQPNVAQIGHELRQARESKGLTLVQVAREIRLDVRYLEALEAGALEHLPGAVFARGYLRSYGRYLGMDPEPLVAVYDRATPRSEPTILRSAPKPRYVLALQWIPWSQLGSAVFVVAALVVAFWLGSVLYGMFGADSIDSGGEDVAAPPSGTTLALPPLPSAEESARSLPPPEIMQTPAADSPGTPLPGPAAPEPPPATAPDDFTTAPEAAPSSPLPQRRGTLSLEFKEDSWVEVYDATDRRLISRIGKAGETPVFEGVPPFSVVLGFAPGVAVAYNGQPIDVRTRGQVARLTVGDNGQ